MCRDAWRTGARSRVEVVVTMAQIMDEINKTEQAAVAVLNAPDPLSKFFRPPFGEVLAEQVTALEAAGYTVVNWVCLFPLLLLAMVEPFISFLFYRFFLFRLFLVSRAKRTWILTTGKLWESRQWPQ